MLEALLPHSSINIDRRTMAEASNCTILRVRQRFAQLFATSPSAYRRAPEIFAFHSA